MYLVFKYICKKYLVFKYILSMYLVFKYKKSIYCPASASRFINKKKVPYGNQSP